MFSRARTFGPLIRRGYCHSPKIMGGTKPAASSGSASGSVPVSNVTGLSSSCVKPTSNPVGPGASPTAEYKVPEYFCFNRFSFAEAEVEMAKYRCPQPSALKK